MSILDFSRLFSDVHSPFRVSINPFQPIRVEKTDLTNNQSLMKSWFISSGLILLRFSERSLKLLTFMLSMNSWAFNGFTKEKIIPLKNTIKNIRQQSEKTPEGNV
jgi:hypothetical protein